MRSFLLCVRRPSALWRPLAAIVCLYGAVSLSILLLTPTDICARTSLDMTSPDSVLRRLDAVLEGTPLRRQNDTLDAVVHRLVWLYDRGVYVNIINGSKVYVTNPVISPRCMTSQSLLVFVQSHPSHFQQRRRIRETWGAPRSDIYVCVVFAIGVKHANHTASFHRTLRKEIRHNKDVLMLYMNDAYDSLTYKGLLSMIWVAHFAPNVNYFFKTDDDVLVNVFAWSRLLHLLHARNITCAIAGVVWQNPIVIRYGKYQVFTNEYEYAKYPSFCSGAGYLMTRSALTNIVAASVHLPLLRRDDPYFTGIVRHQLGIPLIRVPESSYLFSVDAAKDKLNMTVRERPILAVHGADQVQWTNAWSGFVSSHEESTRRNVVKLKTMRLDRGIRLPEEWQLPDHYVCPKTRCVPRYDKQVYYVGA